MIEKLKPLTEVDENNNPIASHMPNGATLMGKINELVDAVNGILDYAPLEMAMKAEPEPADPYAEQRRWIGKLCRFRDNPACEWKYGILDRIYEDTDFPFWDTDCYEYAECEPVLPTDNAIYKGGDND